MGTNSGFAVALPESAEAVLRMFDVNGYDNSDPAYLVEHLHLPEFGGDGSTTDCTAN